MKETIFCFENRELKLVHINITEEKHGQEKKVVAVDVKFEIEDSNSLLLELHPQLRHALYAKDASEDLIKGDTLTKLKFPKMSGFKWDLKLVGAKMIVPYGIDDSTAIVMDPATVDKFAIDCHEGGSVVLEFSVRYIPSSAEIGKLSELLGMTVEASLSPPAQKSLELEAA